MGSHFNRTIEKNVQNMVFADKTDVTTKQRELKKKK